MSKPKQVEKQLQSIAASLRVPDSTRKAADMCVNNIDVHVRKYFSSTSSNISTDISIDRLLYGGSLQKGTAVSKRFDVDLVFLLNISIDVYMGGSKWLRDVLTQCLSQLPGFEISEPSAPHRFPSVKGMYMDLDFDIQLGVNANYVTLQNHVLSQPKKSKMKFDAKLLSSSASEEEVRMISTQHENIHHTVQLLKAWREQKQLLHFKSIYIELLVMFAHWETGKSSLRDLCLEVFGILASLQDPKFRKHPCRVWASTLYSVDDPDCPWKDVIPAMSKNGMIILHPAFPVIDICAPVTSDSMMELSGVAERSKAKLAGGNVSEFVNLRAFIAEASSLFIR